jgi:hypothetical protein
LSYPHKDWQFELSQSNETHHRRRVIFYTAKLHFEETLKMNTHQLFWEAAGHFKNTREYAWVEDNAVALQWAEDSNVLAWHKQVVFYGDLTERQYIDYALRFL